MAVAVNWNDAFGQRGLAAQTAAPMNVEDADLPPGAPAYSGGPLANPPRPTPTPSPDPSLSLTTLAAGGMNHAQLWMTGQASAPPFQQQPFSPKRSLQETVAQPPPERKITREQVRPFAWASAFDQS